MQASSLVNELTSMIANEGDGRMLISILLGGQRINVTFEPISIKRQHLLHKEESFIEIVAQ